MARIDDVIQFYKWMDNVATACGGYRRLSECNGRDFWPQRGVYFFFEDGEMRSTSGDGLRLVRVGTHALTAGSKSTLWQRLSQHRGRANGQGGNHRGSIFRLLLGQAIASSRERQRQPFLNSITESWGRGSSASREVRGREIPLETAVSKHIGDMPFVWVGISDDPGRESNRGILERNVIGLISNAAKPEDVDPPSETWLGKHSDRQTIRESGLWNQNHVYEGYDIDEIERSLTTGVSR